MFLLDVTNGKDLFCLQYVYLHRINHAIKKFCDGYKNHRLQTARNSRPIQVWITGMLQGAELQNMEDLDIVSDAIVVPSDL